MSIAQLHADFDRDFGSLNHHIVDAIPDAILLVDGDGDIALANRAAVSLFGDVDGVLVGTNILALMPDRFRAQHDRHLRQYFRQPGVRPMGMRATLWALRNDGVEFPVDILLAPARVAGAPQVLVALRDVTERHRVAEELRGQEERLRALFEENPAIFFLLDAGSRISEANRYAVDFFGRPRAALLGLDFFALVHEESHAAVNARLAEAFATPGTVVQATARLELPGHAECRLKLALRVVAAPDAAPYALVSAEDVTKSVLLSRRLSHQATHDQLTGLANRLGFEQRLEALVARDGDEDEDKAHTLCFVDLDQFKIVNDTCGHLAGDLLLQQVARVFEGATRPLDIVARLGGDEFAIVFVDCVFPVAEQRVDRMRETLDRLRFNQGEYSFGVGMSVGLVEFDGRARDWVELLKKADTACYSAKFSGRGRSHVYLEDDAMLQTRSDMRWAARIQRALDFDEFVLWAQPIVPVAPGAAPAEMIEILIRLRTDDRMLVAPNVFLPAAERYGFSSKIDDWVVAHTVRWLESLPAERRPICHINLSGLSLGDARLLDRLQELLAASPIDKHRLVFEITETAAVANLPAAVEVMNRLRGLGCRFALDDFGSGMSSFAYLTQIPVEIIKIDGAFIRNIATDPLAAMIARSVSEIAHAVGMATVAEFVESPEVLALLAGIGVDFAQGYGIAHPAPLSA
ncbi:MAG: EAL domain-containing protein [Gammaproteobacteria bacterium]|nr:EAL domain-containing protein [Gammaproteobacteria bacterium]